MKNVMENVPHEVLEATCSTAPAGNRRESGLTHLDLYEHGKKPVLVWVWLLVSIRTGKGEERGNGNMERWG